MTDAADSKPPPRRSDALVVGAGLAGLAAARGLAAAGFAVTVLEKSRGLGGRLATRRADPLVFDHGAPFVDAPASGPFAEAVAAAVAAGSAAPWSPDGDEPVPEGHRRVVGVPGMSRLVRPLARGLAIETGATASALAQAPDGWRVACAPGGDGAASVAYRAEQLVLAIPAPQAALLLAGAGLRVDALDAVAMAPVWTVMAAFPANAVPPGAAVARPADGPFERVVREASKPGRASPEGSVAVVAHARPAWTRPRLEDDRAAIAERLGRDLVALLGATAPPRHLSAHRWRYALCDDALGAPFLHMPDRALGLAGDWCPGGGAVHAWWSGAGLAEAIAGGHRPGEGRASGGRRRV